MKKILFLGSKPIGYKCLDFLLQNAAAFQCEVVGVLSNDNQRFDNSLSIRKLTSDHGIPFIDELDAILEMKDVDFIISVQYHLILRQKHIDVANEMAINLHMAPLPEYRGCNQFSFAIFNQASSFGTTLHRLESGIDNGAIIAERRFDMENDQEVKPLYDKTFEESVLLFEENIGNVLSGNYTLNDQANLIDERGLNTYYRKDIAQLKKIDLNDSADVITRKVRATAMPGFEPPFAIVDGKKYYIIPENQYQTN